MTLYQRLGLVTDEEYADRWLSLTRDFPGAMDGVWVQTAYGYPPLEAHREYARLLGVATEKFRHQYAEFLRELFECGIPIVYGSDAHTGYPDNREAVEKYLISAGFKEGDISEISEQKLW